MSGTYRFDGFTESVIDAMVMTMLRAQREVVDQELGEGSVRDELFDGDKLLDYEYETKILATIIAKIAEVKGEPAKEVRDRIFRGYFTGHMMHLRDVEAAYGKDALKVFSRMQSHDEDPDMIMNTQIARYLNAKTQKARDTLAKKILES